ncbi:hypothetical protein WDZ92_29530 [Nostoc sp. NIES-2111]
MDGETLIPERATLQHSRRSDGAGVPGLRISAEKGPIARSEWNAFAESSKASFHGSASGRFYWLHQFLNVFRRVDVTVYAGEGPARQKIGQCSVAVGRKVSVFAYGLQLAPGFEEFFCECLCAVLQVLGPGRYQYGSKWSLEPARESWLARIPGVTVGQVRHFGVDAVDLSAYQCVNHYISSVATNAKRNLKKAERADPPLTIRVRRGLSTALDIPSHLKCRIAMYRRKGVPYSVSRMLLAYLLRATLLREYSYSAVAMQDGSPVATFGAVTFGSQLFYIDGGSTDESTGFGWALTLHVLADHFAKQPQGYFVLGCADLPADEDESHFEVQVRSRRDARAARYRTAMITFDWQD